VHRFALHRVRETRPILSLITANRRRRSGRV